MSKHRKGGMDLTGFVPQLERIWHAVLASHNVLRIETAPFKEDYLHATDMIAYTKKGYLRLANRVRSYKHYELHQEDFVLRSVGDPTEIYKIVYQGYGDYYLYAFANQEAIDIHAWVVLDLEVFRREYLHALDVRRNGLDERSIVWEAITWVRRPFRAFKLETFVPEIVVASHHHNRLPKVVNTLKRSI